MPQVLQEKKIDLTVAKNDSMYFVLIDYPYTERNKTVARICSGLIVFRTHCRISQGLTGQLF